MDNKQELLEAIRLAGVTGAGGAGFPTYFKLQAQAEYLIANGAECEPLAHVDKELLLHQATQVISGMRTAIRLTGASLGIIGVKGKYQDIIAHLKAELGSSRDIVIKELGNFYPAGDEHVLVYDTVGRVVPEGGLPINVGCVVQNIETLYNIHNAVRGRPVTHKYITVTGAVQRPATVRVPIGVALGEVLALVGGATTPDPVVLDGGAMMGDVARSLNDPVTKRTKLLLVLPYDHQLSVKRRTSRDAFEHHAIASCDQCFMCTDYCPRHAQGHAIQPHKLILLLASGVPLTDAQMAGAMLCCECRTCNYACPVHLSPGDIALNIKRDLVKAGMKNPYHRQTEASPFREYRRVPINRLVHRLGLSKYDLPAPLVEVETGFRCVTILLRQHIGQACRPTVRVGDAVQAGDVVGLPPEGMLGAPVHASISGVVTQVRPDAVVIEGK